jgi:predicted glycogen debranching enzyme
MHSLYYPFFESRKRGIMIRFGEDVTKDYARSSRLEWLLTNGLGGYASSTVAGANTRRYHGLLVAAVDPPVGRTMLLQKLEETININNVTHDLSVNAYHGTLYPNGHQYLEEFKFDPLPVWRYRIGELVLEKEVCMPQSENTVVIRYRMVEAPGLSKFSAVLLVNCRSYHSLSHESTLLGFTTDIAGSAVRIDARPQQLRFHVLSDRGEFEPTGHWYRDFIYAREQERGYDFQEDLYSPGRFVAELRSGESVSIVASTMQKSYTDLDILVSREKQRIQNLAGVSDDEFLRRLLIASDAFLVRRATGGRSCIAGYHWFCDWGRDTMISLPGVSLVTRRFNDAKLILKTFARNIRYGLIPNTFSESDGSPQYNSLDATLWFFHALRKYYQYTRDVRTVEALFPALVGSVDALLHGTIFDVKADSDLLLNIGRNDVQLTWMDAKIGDYVVTPRNGKPVEINALWYSALDTMVGFAHLLGHRNERDRFSNIAVQVKNCFSRTFWNSEAHCLFDRVIDGFPDASMRPNQIIACALPKSILSNEQERCVVRSVQGELLTPFGLRTLSPKDPRYKGSYEGDQNRRDLSYHQGSAWPWLLGQFVKAYVRTAEDATLAREAAGRFLEPIRMHLFEAGLGFISELFDGDAPYQPKGCIAQAWSVAEVLRAYYEDVLGLEPADPFSV